MRKLTGLYTVLLTVGVIGTNLAAAQSTGALGKTDQQQLQGSWSLVAAEGSEGKASADEVKRIAGKMDFADGKVVWEHNGNAMDTTVEIGHVEEPKTIDLTVVGETFHGIYRLDKDRLTVCVSPKALGRPATFAAKSGSKFPMVLVYERSGLDQTRLQGVWIVSAHEIEGEHSEKFGYKGATVTFDGNKMTVLKPAGSELVGRFSLDEAARPKALDLTPQEGKNKGQTLTGIYSLEGDALKVCLPTVPGIKRSEVFASTPGHRQVLVLTRDKK